MNVNQIKVSSFDQNLKCHCFLFNNKTVQPSGLLVCENNPP